jgi:hypothetical protein
MHLNSMKKAETHQALEGTSDGGEEYKPKEPRVKLSIVTNRGFYGAVPDDAQLPFFAPFL